MHDLLRLSLLLGFCRLHATCLAPTLNLTYIELSYHVPQLYYSLCPPLLMHTPHELIVANHGPPNLKAGGDMCGQVQ